MSLMRFVASVLVLAASLLAFAQPGADPVAVARRALNLLLSFEYKELSGMFDDRMQQAVTENVFQHQLAPIFKGLGTAEKIGNPVVQDAGGLHVVVFPVHFSTGDYDVVLPVDNQGKLAGISYRPGKPPEAETKWTAPPYVNASAFRDREVTIGSGEWKLPGTLSIPNGAGSFPAVVLVHGSGPHDRDETVGGAKPFRDIAEGLASRGIAVLRYDKRTKVYAQQMAAIKDLTVEQETIADALEALAFVSTQKEVNPKRVYLLGHSLGAYLGPRIAQRDPKLAGLIIMAGITRPLQDVMLEQFQYLGAKSDQIAQLKQEAAEIRNLQSAEGAPILNAPRSYWLDLNKYDPKAAVQKLHCRILVLQGGRDYQVSQVDYVGWQQALRGHADATFHPYPSLNHLFIAGEGKSMPAEYQMPGHVAEQVIGDIAAWITG
jgi:dienelactone hydrolase